MSMSPAARKLTAEISGRSGPGRRPTSWLEPAVVFSVTPGGASDGNALCIVTWRGVEAPVAYPVSYAPMVGDAVQVHYQPPSLIIIAHIIGTP